MDRIVAWGCYLILLTRNKQIRLHRIRFLNRQLQLTAYAVHSVYRSSSSAHMLTSRSSFSLSRQSVRMKDGWGKRVKEWTRSSGQEQYFSTLVFYCITSLVGSSEWSFLSAEKLALAICPLSWVSSHCCVAFLISLPSGRDSRVPAPQPPSHTTDTWCV